MKIYAVVDVGDYYTPTYEAYYSSEELAHKHMRKFHPEMEQSETDKCHYWWYYIDELEVLDAIPEEMP